MLDMHIRPSDLMGIEDAYTAFCFDEACAYIIGELQDDKKPILTEGETSETAPKHYSKPSDVYKKFEGNRKED